MKMKPKKQTRVTGVLGLGLVALGLGGVSWAGDAPVLVKQLPPALAVAPLPPVCDCFDTGGLGVDLFGVYVAPSGDDLDDSFGGGVALTQFVNSYLGFSSGVYWWDDGEAVVHSVTGSVVLRYPIRSACIAPYAIGGAGGHFNSVNQFTWHVGGGLEVRVPSLSCVGFFAEGTYNWADETSDYAVVRAGVRYNF